MESFIVNFGTSAYTCRLTSCSYATVGFESAKHLIEHEHKHTRRFQCAAPGCQYPPLVSKAALESHIKRHHTPVVASKPILRRALGSKRNSSNHSEAPSNETSANREQTQTRRWIEQLQLRQLLAIMDLMDLPPEVFALLQNQITPEIKNWGQLNVWLKNSNLPPPMRTQLKRIQQRQYQQQLILQQRHMNRQKNM